MWTTSARGAAFTGRARSRRTMIGVLAAGVASIASIGRADVVTVFDNYKPNFGTATFSGQVINPLGPQRDRDFANAFVPTASGVVTEVWATVTMVSGVNEVDLWLMSDSNGAPDRVLEGWHLVNKMGLRGGLNPPLHVLGDGSTFIEAGETYWLVSSAPLPTVAQWMHNGINDRGPVLYRENNGSWNVSSNNLRGAFRVDVPEPATLVMLLAGAGMVLRRRMRRVAR